MSLSPTQLAIRRDGITATDVAKIVGVHPFGTALDVWLEKTGQAKPFAGNLRTKWGELLEPVIRDDFAERHDLRIELCGTVAHPKIPWRRATPDGLCYRRTDGGLDRGLEIKVHNRETLWRMGIHYGDPGSDDVPLWELTQCMWGLDVVGVDRWDLCVFLDGVPTDYVIRRDDEAVRVLGEVCQRFLVDNLHKNTPPAPDGSARYGEWLRDRWKENTEDLVDVTGDERVRADIERLRKQRAMAADLEREIEATTQRLKLVIGDKGGITWTEDGKKKPHKLTWRRSKGRTVTDWISVMADMRQAAALAASGQFREFERAITCLESVQTLENSRATITGQEIIALLTQWRETLTGIAKASTEPNHKHEKAGNRPFLVPRNWKGTQEHTDD